MKGVSSQKLYISYRDALLVIWKRVFSPPQIAERWAHQNMPLPD